MDMTDLFNMLFDTAMNPKPNEYKEILKLDQLLNDAKIPHELYQRMGGFQVTYYGHQKPEPTPPGETRGSGFGAVCSAIENNFSYGHENDLIEISGLMTDEEYKVTDDSVLGNLTAEDVFSRIKSHWDSK